MFRLCHHTLDAMRVVVMILAAIAVAINYLCSALYRVNQ